MTAPVFSSFDDAWSWFAGGGELVTQQQMQEGWTHGRAQFIAFLAPLADPAAVEHARAVQFALGDIEGVRPTAPEQLHITLLGVGFQVIERRRDDDVLRQDVPRIAARAARPIAATRAVAATVGPPNVFPDAVILEVHDDGRLALLRSALAGLREGEPPQSDATPYLPHVTIATFDRADAAPALRERLAPLRDAPAVPAALRRIELVRAWFVGDDDDAPEPELDLVRAYLLKNV